MEVKLRYRGEFESWTEATVDHIKASTENALSTGPFGSSIGSQFFEDRGVPVIRGSNLANDGRTYLIDDGLIFVSEAKATEFRRSAVFQGDLIFTCWGTINQVGLVSDRAAYPRYIISNKQMKLTPDPKKADSAFLFYLFSGSDLQRQIKNQSIGSSVPGFNLGRLRALRFRVPALHEQKAIAKALSDADALIESLEQLLTKKRQIKNGAMQELLTGKKRLPGFREAWELRTFGVIFEYCPTATNSRSDLLPEGDTFYVHYGDIHTRFHNHLDFGVVKPPQIDRSRCSNAALLKNGDWVMADASEDHEGVGKAVEIQGLDTDMAAVAGLHTLLLREKKPTFSPGFKGHLGNSRSLHQQLRRVATGMKVFGVSKAALKEIELPVPSPQEQGAIAAILSDMDTEIAALEAKLSKARQIKQGMMQELLTGRTRLV